MKGVTSRIGMPHLVSFARSHSDSGPCRIAAPAAREEKMWRSAHCRRSRDRTKASNRANLLRSEERFEGWHQRPRASLRDDGGERGFAQLSPEDVGATPPTSLVAANATSAIESLACANCTLRRRRRRRRRGGRRLRRRLALDRRRAVGRRETRTREAPVRRACCPARQPSEARQGAC